MNGIKVNRKIKRVLIFFGCIMMISLLAICAVYAFWYREQVKITEFDVSLIPVSYTHLTLPTIA